MSKKATTKRRVSATPINPNRKLISRNETADLLGCSTMTLRRMAKSQGGPLDVVKLRGPKSTAYFKVEQVNSLFDIDCNSANNP